MKPDSLETLTLADPQTYKHVVLFPITISNKPDGLDYLTLGEALDDRLLTVTEVSEGGSVPDLKVQSKADQPILLLDGEELAGAKQNRVLNTSVLVAAQAGMMIPVSCTEQGRWAYMSDQGAVWSEIEGLHESAGTFGSSSTRAMRDAFEAQKADLDEAMAAFEPVTGQHGLYDH